MTIPFRRASKMKNISFEDFKEKHRLLVLYRILFITCRLSNWNVPEKNGNYHTFKTSLKGGGVPPVWLKTIQFPIFLMKTFFRLAYHLIAYLAVAKMCILWITSFILLPRMQFHFHKSQNCLHSFDYLEILSKIRTKSLNFFNQLLL